MKNAIGRDIPDELLTNGCEVYRSNNDWDDRDYSIGRASCRERV